LDFGVAQLTAKTAHETGTGPQNLVFPSNTETHRWLTPRLEAGAEHTLKSGFKLREFVSFGVQTYLSHPETFTRAGLANAPAGVDPMMLPIALGQHALHTAVGFELIAPRGISVQLGYRNLTADHLKTNRGDLKLSFAF
jgi:hypothetical protein